jgi:hypothetical protein
MLFRTPTAYPDSWRTTLREMFLAT